MKHLRPTLLLAGLAILTGPAVAAAAPTAPALSAPPAVTPATSVQVLWSGATFDALATGTKYTVDVRTVAGGVESAPVVTDVPVGTTQFTVTPLANATTYRVRVTASELPCLDAAPVDPCVTQATDPDGRVGAVSNIVEFTVDRTAPGASISLAGGAAWTSDETVSTGLTASDPSGLRMVLASTAAGTACANPASCGVPYSPNPTFTLPAGDGPKTVYARLVDAAGNSVVVNDGIGLDTSLPDLWATADDLTVDTGDTVAFSTRSATDTGSGIEEPSFAWAFCKGCATGATGRTASRRFTAAGTYEITLRARDLAGNVGSDSFTVTVTDPDPATPATTGGGGTTTGGGGGTTTGGGPTLSKASLYGTAKVGKVMRVRVTLAASAKVTVEIRTTPVRGRTTLLKRFRSRIAFPKGASIFRLSAPTRAATRLIVVKAGGQTKSFRVTIRG